MDIYIKPVPDDGKFLKKKEKIDLLIKELESYPFFGRIEDVREISRFSEKGKLISRHLRLRVKKEEEIIISLLYEWLSNDVLELVINNKYRITPVIRWKYERTFNPSPLYPTLVPRKTIFEVVEEYGLDLPFFIPLSKRMRTSRERKARTMVRKALKEFGNEAVYCDVDVDEDFILPRLLVEGGVKKIVAFDGTKILRIAERYSVKNMNHFKLPFDDSEIEFVLHFPEEVWRRKLDVLLIPHSLPEQIEKIIRVQKPRLGALIYYTDNEPSYLDLRGYEVEKKENHLVVKRI